MKVEINNVKDWLKERFPIDYEKLVQIGENIFIKEPIPVHMKKWFLCSGATPLIIFGLQVVTGVLLTFYYVPSPEMAYESVRHITEDVRLGFWIRGLHRWGSNFMIIALILHMIRVFFTRAYQRPRELNWVIGSLLLLTTLMLSMTGYSLIYNQVSYWATTVGTNMARAIPFAGETVLTFMRGGPDVTTNTLSRFFILHMAFLPIIMIVLIAAHIIILRVHGMSELPGYPEEHYPFYPEHFYKIIIITLFVLCLLSILSVISPPGLGIPADPSNTPLHIKPEWYFFPIYRFLKLVPLQLGLLLTGLVICAMIFWPFIEPYISKDEQKRVKISRIIALFATAIMIWFTLWETISV